LKAGEKSCGDGGILHRCSLEIEPGIIVQIRLLAPGDAEAFRALRLAALKECPTAFTADYETNLRRPLSHFAAQIQSAPDNFMVGAFRNLELVAITGFYRSEGPKLRHRGNIWSVYVASDLRRSGLGRKMLDEVIARARSLDGMIQIHLSVVADNIGARTLYLNSGFEIVGRAPRAIHVDGKYFDEDLLVLPLERYLDLNDAASSSK
jgi:ribosomal protein S18 acetylase RimI-like enzyme